MLSECVEDNTGRLLVVVYIALLEIEDAVEISDDAFTLKLAN